MPPAIAESGGSATVFDDTETAFARSLSGLDARSKQQFAVGNAFFNDNWVAAPASAEGRDGLGPIFNAASCSGCHARDGRSRPPDVGADLRAGTPGLLFRIGVPQADGTVLDDTTYGSQLQDRSIPGVPAEGYADITYRPISGTYRDKSEYELLEPDYTLMGALEAFDSGLRESARVAPALVGPGLLEAVPIAEIERNADADDRDGNGISGRIAMVRDQAGATVLGRFGWKATQPTVRSQVAAAFAGDIGITSALQPAQPCTAAQTACSVATTGGTPELDDAKLDRVTFYTRALAVPARRNATDDTVRAGATLFANIGCSSCHSPTMQTGPADIPALSNQTIHPYTDLLLHDMGPALDDGLPEGAARSAEWRTAPLWGIGLVHTVNGHTRFLHDGRARTLSEAIVWHGGESQRSRDKFINLSARQRDQLITFLESL
jgi:CxxC motif-containing protein (DUF1111 family)